MYIRTVEGFGFGDETRIGQLADSTPKDQLVGTCIAWVVNVQFKPDLKEFRQELLKAIGRNVAARKDKLQLSALFDGTGMQGVVQSIHSDLLKQTAKLQEHKNNVPIKATLHFASGRLAWFELVLLGGFLTTP